MQRVTFEMIDPETRCIVQNHVQNLRDVNEFCAILEIDDASLRNGECFNLDELDVKALRDACLVPEGFPIQAPCRVRSWLAIDDLPYTVHTGRELLLMLKGIKPLSVFSTALVDDFLIKETEEIFRPYVVSGRLLKREYVELADKDSKGLPYPVHVVLYALPAEEWRIDAMLLLRSIWSKEGWSRAFERMEGRLLGYEEWQIDIYTQPK